MSHLPRKSVSRRAASTRSAFQSLVTFGVSATSLVLGSQSASATDHIWNVTSGNFNTAAN